MIKKYLRGYGLVAILMIASVGACSGSGSAPDPSSETSEAVAEAVATGDTDESSDEGYVFDAERDDIATAIEQAFSTRDATADWEGDEFVLAIDEDLPDIMPGFSECRIVTEFILETDTARIDFRDGSVGCEEALKDT